MKHKMISTIRKLRVINALGWCSVASVLVYRWKIKLRIHPAQFLKNTFEEKSLFTTPKMLEIKNTVFLEKPFFYKLFGWKEIRLDWQAIDWLSDQINANQHQNTTSKWWCIPKYWDGKAGARIVRILENILKNHVI